VTTRIAKAFTFEAAHQLPEHDGKCSRPHGHTYRVEVTLTGEPLPTGPKRGMVMDFGDVSQVWHAELEPFLDHRDLNVTLGPDLPETTAEWIAAWCYDRFRKFIDNVERVRVWETRTSWAEYPA